MQGFCFDVGRVRLIFASVFIAVGLLTSHTADASQPKKKQSSAQVQKKNPTTKKLAKQKRPGENKQALAQKSRKGKTPQGAVARASKHDKKAFVARTNVRPRAGVGAAAERYVARASMGEQLGLRQRVDPLELSASVALVLDQDTNEVLFSKNEAAVLPIASITKLMTGLVIADAHLPMSESITITQDDVDTFKGSSSRLAVGTTLSREELMHLALMSSENRAAHALGRTYPGGLSHFVQLMNQKANALGMSDTRFVEPTGLSSSNQSSARDLATLAAAAYERPILRQLSTSPSHYLDVGRRVLRFNNSNKLIHNPDWQIGLQKTGYISEAGRCLVMQAQVAGRKLIMVLLDSAGKASRADDAERMRKWVEATTLMQWPERPRS
jgi:D-alanyl-D-alanine endopeptidase (penicillin-binding protein 7)